MQLLDRRGSPPVRRRRKTPVERWPPGVDRPPSRLKGSGTEQRWGSSPTHRHRRTASAVTPAGGPDTGERPGPFRPAPGVARSWVPRGPSIPGAPRAAPVRGAGRTEEEHRGPVPPEADPETSLGPVLPFRGIDPPVDHPDLPSPGPRGEPALRPATQFRSVPGGQPEVPSPDHRRGNGPAAEGRPHPDRRVRPPEFRVGNHGNHPRGTGHHLPGPRVPAGDLRHPGGPLAVPIASPSARAKGAPERRRETAGAFHARASLRVRSSHALPRRSSQAAAVRATCSENPVKRCSTDPSDHSRKTWGMR